VKPQQYFVTPTQAGVQENNVEVFNIFWIPACAGMTILDA
jgi:hypothetical protein